MTPLSAHEKARRAQSLTLPKIYVEDGGLRSWSRNDGRRQGQLALSLPRELKDTPASAGLRIQLSYIDTHTKIRGGSVPLFYFLFSIRESIINTKKITTLSYPYLPIPGNTHRLHSPAKPRQSKIYPPYTYPPPKRYVWADSSFKASGCSCEELLSNIRMCRQENTTGEKRNAKKTIPRVQYTRSYRRWVSFAAGKDVHQPKQFVELTADVVGKFCERYDTYVRNIGTRVPDGPRTKREI